MLVGAMTSCLPTAEAELAGVNFWVKPPGEEGKALGKFFATLVLSLPKAHV